MANFREKINVKDFINKGLDKLRSDEEAKNPETEQSGSDAEERKTQLREKCARLRERLSEADKRVTIVIYNAINAFDDKADALAERISRFASTCKRKLYEARDYAEHNKKKVLAGFACLVVFLICGVGVFNLCTSYEYAYNGRTLGLVNNQEDVLRILDLVSENLTVEHNAEVSIDPEEDITFKRVVSIGKEVDDMEQVLKRLTYMQDIAVNAYSISVNGRQVAIVDNEETANAALDTVKAAFTAAGDNTTIDDVGFAEEVTVEKLPSRLGRVENVGDVVQKLMTGSETIEKHTVEAGDTFSGIAKKYGISMADLQATNPLVTPEKLSIGQEIILTKPAPMVTVQTVETSTLTEYIDFQTTYEENPNVYQGETTTKVAGQMGERQVTARIVRNNGVEVARMELASTIVKEPVTAVISIGTKELPPKQGTGTFIYPVTGARLTSRFGTRWGRMHYGIDLAIASGTKIRASDGGTVIFSGYSGSYGYVVKIDHGGGFVTVYAHCSKLNVRVGEKVYQGQYIAKVGSTGRSTGPHCHFEVQYLGVQKNPLNYL